MDCFGRPLDLTSLINKPDGYLQGRLSDVGDADYYQFNIAEYRILGTVSDKHNLDITVTLTTSRKAVIMTLFCMTVTGTR